jgi:hypothetical protein
MDFLIFMMHYVNLTYIGAFTIEMECVSGWICNGLRRTSFKEDFYY